MSWKALTQVARRLHFVKLALKAQQSMSRLCRLFRISRKSGYKWKHRFEHEGRQGLLIGSVVLVARLGERARNG